MVAVLLAGLTRLGGNAYIAKRLIAMLAAHAPGRFALRTACSRWRAQATGLPDDAGAAHAAALQWAISRLWQQGARALQHSTLTVLTCLHAALSGPQRFLCGNVSTIRRCTSDWQGMRRVSKNALWGQKSWLGAV